eukprot:jgi/Chlat1/554/Chrsp103S01003
MRAPLLAANCAPTTSLLPHSCFLLRSFSFAARPLACSLSSRMESTSSSTSSNSSSNSQLKVGLPSSSSSQAVIAATNDDDSDEEDEADWSDGSGSDASSSSSSDDGDNTESDDSDFEQDHHDERRRRASMEASTADDDIVEKDSEIPTTPPSPHDVQRSIMFQRNWAYLESLKLWEVEFLDTLVERDELLDVLTNKDAIGPILYLQQIKVPYRALQLIVRKYPFVLGMDVKTELKPLVEYFTGIGYNLNAFRISLKKYPRQLLRMDIERELKPAAEYLKEIGVIKPEVPLCLVRFAKSTAKDLRAVLESKLAYLCEAGVTDQKHLARLVSRKHSIMFNSMDQIRSVVEFLKSVGVKDEELGDVLTRNEKMFEKDAQRVLRPKWEYLSTAMNKDVRAILESPQVLDCSLDSTIRPRWLYLKERKLKEINLPLHKYMLMKDKDYARTIARSTPGKYKTFKKTLLGIEKQSKKKTPNQRAPKSAKKEKLSKSGIAPPPKFAEAVMKQKLNKNKNKNKKKKR